MHNSFSPKNGTANVVKAIRCGIYTRKSTEEGLEQEFNSLHAQREAGEAYITSQKEAGWKVLPDHYDDGGFSGGADRITVGAEIMRSPTPPKRTPNRHFDAVALHNHALRIMQSIFSPASRRGTPRESTKSIAATVG